MSMYFEVYCTFRIIFCPTSFPATYFASVFPEIHLVCQNHFVYPLLHILYKACNCF